MQRLFHNGSAPTIVEASNPSWARKHIVFAAKCDSGARWIFRIMKGEMRIAQARSERGATMSARAICVAVARREWQDAQRGDGGAAQLNHA
jgi:hypothetical protein